MSNLTPAKKIPIKIYYKKELLEIKPDNQLNDLKNKKQFYNKLNKKGYAYPISIYKEPSLYEQYKERLILSEKPKKKKSLINQNYHHLSFKSHSNSMFLNPNNINSNSNKSNNDITNPYKTYYNNMNHINSNKEFKSKKRIFYNTFYNKERSPGNIKLKKNFSSSTFPYRYNAYNNNIYQQNYLSEIEKRGFNYNKLKVASMQRMAMYNYIKFEKDFNYNYNNNEASYILETSKRNYFPQMKKFLINKFKKNSDENMFLSEEKNDKNNKMKGVINIKNNPSFKFHVFHDQKGNIKELDKPCIRSLKMTKERVRDLKVMSKINRINDPEIIEMYKSKL